MRATHNIVYAAGDFPAARCSAQATSDDSDSEPTPLSPPPPSRMQSASPAHEDEDEDEYVDNPLGGLVDMAARFVSDRPPHMPRV